MDELQGILTSYEMIKEKDKPSKYESTLKASRREKTHQTSDSSEEDSDEEESIFIRKLKKGSGKYKGKLPFKCFNCGRVGFFFDKCPYKDKNKNEEDHDCKRNNNQYKASKVERKRGTTNKRKIGMQGMTIVHLMRMTVTPKRSSFWPWALSMNHLINENEGYEEFGNKVEVDFEGEIICTQRELKKLKEKYSLVKDQLEE